MLEHKIYFLFGILVTFVALCGSQYDSTFSRVTPVARKQLLHAFEDAWKLEDIAVLHYATSSFRILKEKLPIPEKDVCSFIQKVQTEANSLEALYHVTAIAKDVPTCSSSQLLSDAGKKVLEITQKENVKMEDLFYVSNALKAISSSITDTAFISKSLKTALKSNETLLNLGYAFHVGSILPKKEAETIFDKIDSVISQVDEIDSKYYQFEGGLTLTSLIIEGIYKLSETVNKTPPLTSTQLVKFLNYFLSRIAVSRPRGAFGLLQVFSKMADNNFHIFVSVDLAQEADVSKTKPTLSVRVSDLFGEPVFKDATPLVVSATAIKKKDGSVVNVKKPFTPTSDKTVYTINANDVSEASDFYELSVVVNTNGKNKKTIPNQEHTIKFKYTYAIKIENFQIGVLDSEQSSTSDLKKLEYPNELKEKFNLDSQQRLVIKFALKDLDFNKPTKVQQAFVKLIGQNSKNEASFVCQPDSNRNFRLSIDPTNAGSALEFTSDSYDVVLIIGDLLLTKSIKWSLATVQIKFSPDLVPPRNEEVYYYYRPKPEIKHLFKEPERRPPAVVSTVFTGFVISPLLILLILWIKLGVNVKNFPFTLSALSFHFGLGSIFVLFGIFWLKLNMFQIIKYLLTLGFITFLSGNKMLRSIANKSKK